jgi:outer membrane protein assembly factor BamB
MKHFLKLFIVIVILTLSCDKQQEDITNVPVKNPGQQTDVIWPSLANTPWPMNHHDPQCTGRSNLLGPTSGSLFLDLTIPSYSEAGVAIGVDSTYLIGGCLLSMRKDGSIQWTTTAQNPFSYSKMVKTTPIITADSSIIFATHNGVIYSLQFNGTIKWQYATGSNIIQQGSTIGKDGVFYCISMQHTLYAINQNGTLRWSINDPKFHGSERAVLSFSPDGNTLYVPGSGITVHALDINTQTIKWSFGTDKYFVIAPLVDCNGYIYILGTDSTINKKPALYCLNANGTVRWIYVHGNTGEPIMSGDPTIDKDGNIYFAFDTLYSVDYSGNLRWKLPLPGWGDPPLVCDEAGNVYVTIFGNSFYETWAVNSSGSIVWKYRYPSTYFIDSSPAISRNGELAVLGMKNYKFYIIK